MLAFIDFFLKNKINCIKTKIYLIISLSKIFDAQNIGSICVMKELPNQGKYHSYLNLIRNKLFECVIGFNCKVYNTSHELDIYDYTGACPGFFHHRAD